MAYPLIPISELINSVFLRLDTVDTRDEYVFEEWAWDAIREIGPSRVDVKTEKIPLEGLCFDKPCDYLYGLTMNLIDCTGGVYYFQFTENGINESDINPCGGKGGAIRVSEGKETFNISSNVKTVGVSHMELSYYSYPLSPDGSLMIEEKMKEPVIAFIEFMYIKRERRRKMGKRDVPLAEIQYLEDVWRRKLRAIRGDIKMPDPIAARTIFRKWASAIPDFKRGAVNSRGMSRKRI